MKLTDPFAKKGMPGWKKALIWMAVIIGLCGIACLALWYFGIWPFDACAPVAEAVETAAEEATEVVTEICDTIAAPAQ